MILDPPRCQLHNDLSTPNVWRRLRGLGAALRRRLRLRTRLRQWRRGLPPPAPALGAPSRFAAGTWVRVKDAHEIFATLDARKQLRGLLWVWQQWPYCGTVHRVFKPVQRMMDDAYQMRAVSGTVLLDTAPCGGPNGANGANEANGKGTHGAPGEAGKSPAHSHAAHVHHGCGRECPLMFRDEWLEEVAPPPLSAHAASDREGGHSGNGGDGGARYATVRSADEIRRTLDATHSRGGLMFMPEMFRHAGQRFRIYRHVDRVLDRGAYVPAAQPLYMLDTLHCTGEAMGENGPCERGCRLLWHADWLSLES